MCGDVKRLEKVNAAKNAAPLIADTAPGLRNDHNHKGQGHFDSN